MGSASADIIIGGAGADTLEGGAGSDIFRYLNADASAVDTINNFTKGTVASGGDIIDVKDLLAGSGVNVNNFSDFVTIRETNGNTIISVDQDGSSTFMPAQDIVTLTGITNLSMDQIMII